jgi:hypothetical protein
MLDVGAIVALLQSGQYQDGKLPVELMASSVVFKGTHVPWDERAFGVLPVRVYFPTMDEGTGMGGLHATITN